MEELSIIPIFMYIYRLICMHQYTPRIRFYALNLNIILHLADNVYCLEGGSETLEKEAGDIMKFRAQLLKVMPLLMIFALTHCGSAEVPMGGIVGNGNGPTKRPSKTNPDEKPADDSNSPETAQPLIAAVDILDALYKVQIPQGYTRSNEGADQFVEDNTDVLTFAWVEGSDANCEARDTYQTAKGFTVKLCSDTLAAVDVGDQAARLIEVKHSLSRATLAAVLDSLKQK
jgi:hypothetical protein